MHNLPCPTWCRAALLLGARLLAACAQAFDLQGHRGAHVPKEERVVWR